MTEKQASEIMEKTIINGTPHPNTLEYIEALNISIDILGTNYTRDQLKNWILINKYPFLMPKYWNPETMQYEIDEDYKYNFTLLDEMPDGWRKAFGEMMCEEIYNALVDCNGLDDYKVEQIKEKFGCYDSETEVLTENGWKFFKDIKYEDKIATLNKETGYLEYQYPTDIIAYHYNGKMYCLQNRGIDLLVTPNHQLYVAKASYYNGTKNNEKRLYPFELCTPDKYFGKGKRFSKTCNWEGIKPNDYFTIKGYSKTRTYCKRTYTFPDLNIEIHSLLRFLGYYIAEGCSDYNRGSISIGRDRSEYKKELCEKLIKDIGFEPKDATNYKRKDNSGCTNFYSTVMARWLIENCGYMAWNKKVPSFIKELPPEYIEEFLEYLYLGDGHKTTTSYILCTTSLQLKNDVEELLLKSGYCFRSWKRKPRINESNKWNIISKHDVYEINWLKLKDIETKGSIIKKSNSYKEEWIDYSGMVYCVTAPNHIIYVKRNGKGVWCGNSLRWYNYPSYEEVERIIDKYSVLSENICMICGKPDVPMTGDAWFYPLCEKCYCTPNDYRKGDMTEEELKEFWNERKKDWEVWNNEDYKMRDKYTIHRWSKDKDDVEEIIYDISETANRIRNKWKLEYKK